MDRLRELQDFWNWLPAFRAVAETEHLPSAAQKLHISPPALSRSLGLLETALGCPLFRRAGRKLELNAEGRRFLARVREGMRRIHEGLVELQEREMKGDLRISSGGLMTRTCVLPVIQSLKSQHPELVPELHAVANADVASALLQGHIDLAFLSSPIHHDRLETRLLGHAGNGIYCGQELALHSPLQVDGATLDPASLDDYEFVAPLPDQDGNTHEGWPSDRPRRIAIRLDSMQLGAEVCAKSRYLAVLPDVIASEIPGLTRLPLEIIPPIALYSMRRDPLGTRSAADLFLSEVEAVLANRPEIQAV